MSWIKKFQKPLGTAAVLTGMATGGAGCRVVVTHGDPGYVPDYSQVQTQPQYYPNNDYNNGNNNDGEHHRHESHEGGENPPAGCEPHPVKSAPVTPAPTAHPVRSAPPAGAAHKR